MKINQKGAVDMLLVAAIAIILIVAGMVIVRVSSNDDEPASNLDASVVDSEITSYEECVAAGYPVMESFPEQCAVPGGETFVNEKARLDIQTDENEEQQSEGEPGTLENEEEDLMLLDGQTELNGEAVGLPLLSIPETCKTSGESTFCAQFDLEHRTTASITNFNGTDDWVQFGVTLDEITREVLVDGVESDDYIAFIVTVHTINSGSDAFMSASNSSLTRSNGSVVGSDWENTDLSTNGINKLGVYENEWVIPGTERQYAVYFDATATNEGTLLISPDGFVGYDVTIDFREQP